MYNCCKYCLEDSKEDEYPLIYPCQCTDGVHPNCLASWLLVRPISNNRCRCEICHSNYNGVFIPPPPPPPPPPSSPLLQPLSDDVVVIVPPHKEIMILILMLCVVNASGMKRFLILWGQYLDLLVVF